MTRPADVEREAKRILKIGERALWGTSHRHMRRSWAKLYQVERDFFLALARDSLARTRRREGRLLGYLYVDPSHPDGDMIELHVPRLDGDNAVLYALPKKLPAKRGRRSR